MGIIGANQYVLSADSTLNQISYYITDDFSPGRAQAALYANDAVNNVPTTLIAQASYTMAVTTLGQWYTQDVPPTYLPAGTYWLAVMEGPNTGNGYGPGLSQGSAAGGTAYYEDIYSWAFPATFSGGPNYYKFGIYGIVCHN